jgi:hypothetical protein
MRDRNARGVARSLSAAPVGEEIFMEKIFLPIQTRRNIMTRSARCATVVLILFASMTVRAQIPQTMSYQGVLSDGAGAIVPDGNYNLTFKLYDVATGTTAALWSEGQLVQVNKGVFNVMLGSVNTLNLPFDKQYWLGISVGLNPELTPRIALASTPYSLNAKSVAPGAAVKSLNGLNDAVTITGGGGATVTSNGNTITITASGGGGTGIQGVQNTNGTLDIANPNGPTATINVKDNGVATQHLHDNAVTSAKIASGAAVKSINTLRDDVTLTAGTNVTITPSGNNLTISASGGSGGGLSVVSHDASMSGDGTSASPLSVTSINGSTITDGTVTEAKIPTGQVVKTVNGLHDNVTFVAGSNVTLTPSGNQITIAATGGSGSGLTAVNHNATLSGDGTGGNPLAVAVPLTLSGAAASPNSLVTMTNTSSGEGFLASSVGGIGVHGTATGANSKGVRGDGEHWGVYGAATGPGSEGVRGDGEAWGVVGNGTGANSTGVKGYGVTWGVYGVTTGPGSAGARGEGLGWGVYGVATEATSQGVRGESPNQGVYGIGTGSNGEGVRGEGVGWGVHGVGTGTNSTGIKGEGTGWGVSGVGTSTNSTGVRGDGDGWGVAAYGTGVNSIGLYAEGKARGVVAVATNTGGTGLDLVGQLKISSTQSNRAAFVHTSTGGSYISTISYPSGMGAQSSSDILMVTPVWTSTYYNHPWAIYWTGSAWAIFSQDATSVIPAGMNWNILVIRTQ